MISSVSQANAPVAAKSAALDPGVDQPAAKLRAGPGQRAPDKLQTGQAVVFVKMLVKQIGSRPGIDQATGQPQRVGRGRGEAEPAGVRRQCGKGRLGDLGRQRHAQGVRRFDDQPAGGLGTGVLEQLRPKVVAADVMVQHRLDRLALPDHVGHLAKLDPGGRVQDNDHLAIAKLLRRHVFAKLLDLLLRVEKGQRRRDGEIVDRQHVLAELCQDARHRQLASQGVAVGPDVADQQEIADARGRFQQIGAS